MPKKVKPVCRECGSDDVRSDAWAVWSVPEQKWELETEFDASQCGKCDGETKLEWIEVEETEEDKES